MHVSLVPNNAKPNHDINDFANTILRSHSVALSLSVCYLSMRDNVSSISTEQQCDLALEHAAISEASPIIAFTFAACTIDSPRVRS